MDRYSELRALSGKILSSSISIDSRWGCELARRAIPEAIADAVLGLEHAAVRELEEANPPRPSRRSGAPRRLDPG